MFESEGSRRPANTRGDTPVDMIRYTDRGHVPPNSKKVRSVVGKSNRHEADPSTNGRSGYRGYTPTPTPTAFNRTINTSTTFHNSANTSFTHSGNASAILARTGGGMTGESSAHNKGAENIRPTSITPTTFLHSTRPASSLATVGANTIPTLKEDDRVVDSLNNLMRDSAMITKSPSALIHLGGTRYDSAELIRGGEERGGGGTTSQSTEWRGNNNGIARGHEIGAPMPDPRYVLNSVRREREALGEGDAHHQHQHQHHYGGLAGAVPMATIEDSRSRIFKARAGSALGVGASEDHDNHHMHTSTSGYTNNDTSSNSSPRTYVNISVGLPAVHGAVVHNGVIGITQHIGGGSVAAMRSTGGYSPNGTTSEAVGNARKKPDPFFFSQRHEGGHPEADPSGLVRRTRFTNGNATFNGDPLSYPAATSASTALLYGGSRHRNPLPTDTVGSMPCYERSSSAYGNGGGGGNINSLDTHTSVIMNGTRGSAATVRAHSSLARLRGTGQGWGSTASSSAQFHNISHSITARPQVFEDIAAINNATLRPKLRFELTDYHNSFVNFQAPPTSAMSTTATIRFLSADRGLGSTLLGQEDKLKKSARAAAHAEVIRGTEERVRDNVNAEGARMRRLREARGGLPTY